MAKIQKITPFLWFDHEAEEAVNFYVSIFKNSKITGINRYTEEGAKVSGQKAGSVMVVSFDLEGQQFSAINGGPFLKMSGGISFVINCKDQAEVDHFWEKLSSDGGEAGQCGWINHDKYGVTWQVTPEVLGKMMSDPDEEKAGRVMAEMVKMKKIIIKDLERAYKGK